MHHYKTRLVVKSPWLSAGNHAALGQGQDNDCPYGWHDQTSESELMLVFMFLITQKSHQNDKQMSIVATLTIFALLAFMLTGCKFGTPFSGPVTKGSKSSSNETAVIALSYVKTGDDSAKNKIFWDYVMTVNDNLPKYKGYLGHSIRRVVLGKEGWTMTVWENEQSLDEFVRGDLHQQAIAKSLNAIAKARFVRLAIKRSEVPISWEKAEQILAEQGRDLY